MKDLKEIMKYGAIFDWDGVVVDSGARHMESWHMLADKHGFNIEPDFFLKTFGRRNLEIVKDMYHWTDDPKTAQRLSDEKEVYFRKIIAEKSVDTIPGVVDFIKALNRAEIPCAVGSSTPRENLDVQLKALKMEGLFAATVTMEDVKNGKPAPDVFLLAAQRLGMEPQNCAVFEDSEAGIDAAIAAGEKRVAVATTHDNVFWENREARNPEKRVDAIIPNFLNYTPEVFLKLFA